MPNSQYIFNYLSEKERLAYTKEVQRLSNGMIIYPQEYFFPYELSDYADKRNRKDIWDPSL